MFESLNCHKKLQSSCTSSSARPELGPMVQRIPGYQVPKEHARLRKALLAGNLRTIQSLLKPKTSSIWAWCGFKVWTSYATASSVSVSASLFNYQYADDLGATALSYVILGTYLRDSYMWEAGSAVSAAAVEVSKAAHRTASARLAVLAWLLSPEQAYLWPHFRLDKVNNRCQSVLHCCLLNGGQPAMLRLLVQHWTAQSAKQVETENTMMATDATLHQKATSTETVLACLTTTTTGPTTMTHHKASSNQYYIAAQQAAPAHSDINAVRTSDKAPTLPGHLTPTLSQEDDNMSHDQWPLLSSVLAMKDQDDRTVLDAALAMSDWEIVRILTAAGGMHACSMINRAHAIDHKQLQQVCAQQRVHSRSAAGGSSVTAQLPAVLLAFWPEQPQDLRHAVKQLPCVLGNVINTLQSLPKHMQQQACLSDLEASVKSSGGHHHGLAAHSHPMASDDVVAALREAMNRVQARTGGDESSALALLLSVDYDLERLLLQLNNKSEPHVPPMAVVSSAAAAAGHSDTVSDIAAEISNAQSAAQRCVVCWETLQQSSFSVCMPCGHTTCDTCWQGVLQARLSDGDPWQTCCPEQGCRHPCPLQAVTQLLPPASQQRWFTLMSSHYVQQHPRSTWCPRPGCEHSVLLQLNDASPQLPASFGQFASNPSATSGFGVQAALDAGRGVVVQCECGHRFCFCCGRNAHEPVSCAQIESLSQGVQALSAKEAAATQTYLQEKTKKCVKCGAHTERTTGCNHMVCSRCTAQWCWACGKDWSLHGRHTGGYHHCTLAGSPTHTTSPSTQHKARSHTNTPHQPLWTAAQLNKLADRFTAHQEFCLKARKLLGHMAWLQYQMHAAASFTQQPSTNTDKSNADDAPAHTNHDAANDMLQAAASPTARQLLNTWYGYAALCQGSEVLTWSHALLMFLPPASAPWLYLHSRIQQLAGSVDQLYQLVNKLPHADHVLADTPSQVLATSSGSSKERHITAGGTPAGTSHEGANRLSRTMSWPFPGLVGSSSQQSTSVKGARQHSLQKASSSRKNKATNTNAGVNGSGGSGGDMTRDSAAHHATPVWEQTLYDSTDVPNFQPSYATSFSAWCKVRAAALPASVLHAHHIHTAGASHQVQVIQQPTGTAGVSIRGSHQRSGDRLRDSGTGTDLINQFPFCLAIMAKTGSADVIQKAVAEVMEDCACIVWVARYGKLDNSKHMTGQGAASPAVSPLSLMSLSLSHMARGAAALAAQGAQLVRERIAGFVRS